MPRICTIHYRTNVQTRPYETEHIELVIELDPEDSPGQTLSRARDWCAKQFGRKGLTEEEQRRAAAVDL